MISSAPLWAKQAATYLKSTETGNGTVSSKERKFRNVCYDCKTHGHKWMQEIVLRDAPNTSFLSDSSIYQRAFPKRCKPCRSKHKRYQNALRKFIILDELRLNEGIPNLKFLTKTRLDWNIWIPHGEELQKARNELKEKANRQARNWRFRNEWWKSHNPLGQYWSECVITPIGKIIDGVLIMGYQLHFHQHMILVSKHLDNKPKINVITKEILDDSPFFKEWGGIVHIKKVQDYKNNWYMVKGKYRRGCGKHACVNYLSKYISKAQGWSSQKIGDW